MTDSLPSSSSTLTGRARRPAAARIPRAPLERPAPLREAVYGAIAEMIITRELRPGEHLAENELAAQLGVSRQPVREALQRLHSEGWVDLRPALGASVHVPTEAETDELLAVRTLLESESARLAAMNPTPEQIEHLWELQRTGEEALRDGAEGGLAATNDALHTYIVSMSGNSTLAELVTMVARRVRWYYMPVAKARGADAWDEHAELIEAIAARNARRAATLMKRHTERTRTLFLARSKSA